MIRGDTIKNTFNINATLYKEIKELIKEEKVNSFTEFINDAIEAYLKEIKRQEYAENMIKASKDKNFIKRTMNCQKQFDNIDVEVDKEW